MVKEDLVRGGGSLVSPARGGLPGGFNIISVEHGFWDILSQQRTGKKKKKKKSAGDPMSVMVKNKGYFSITSVSRVMYAALQVAGRHLPPNC